MQEPGGKPKGKFEGIIKKLGVTVPAGQELPHLLNLASEQNHSVENLINTTQKLIDHLATQTERLVGFQKDVFRKLDSVEIQIASLRQEYQALSAELPPLHILRKRLKDDK